MRGSDRPNRKRPLLFVAQSLGVPYCRQAIGTPARRRGVVLDPPQGARRNAIDNYWQRPHNVGKRMLEAPFYFNFEETANERRQDCTD